MQNGKSKFGSLLREALLLVAFPLVFVGTGYALYSQQLTVNGTGRGVTYTSSQGLFVSYAKTVTSSGLNWKYSITFTVKNNGTSTIGSWQVGFAMPTGSTSLSCSTSVTCSTAGMSVTAYNTAGNKTINSGAQRSFTLSFIAPVSNAVLQNLSVSGLYANTYQVIAGLTMTATAGTRTKTGKWYYWPYTIVVTNSSTVNVSAWRITASWSTTETVKTMPTTVNYTTSSTQLTITSKTGVVKGNTFQFVPTLGSTKATWVLMNYIIEGMP